MALSFLDWLENNLYGNDLAQWKQHAGQQGINANRLLQPKANNSFVLQQFLDAQKQLKTAQASGQMSEKDINDIKNLLIALAQQL